MTRTPALLLSNRTAGSSDDNEVAEVAEVLRTRHDLTDASPASSSELHAVLSSFDGERIIVAGGDGSLHVLINALGDLGRLHDVVVGLVPMGTGNDFALGTGTPMDPVAAAHACLDGTPTAIDVIVADDGEHIVNAAHAGIGAVAAERAQATKPIAGQWAYPLGAIQAAVTETGYEVALRLDDKPIYEGAMLMTLVANGPCIGGGTRLCTNADPRDGLVDVLVIEAIPLRERAGLGLDIQRGTHLERDDVRHWRGRHLEIEARDINHNRDGELRHGLDDVRYTIQPVAWRLLR
jgi:YegS/Rv2252/BmrU family lipid kinase